MVESQERYGADPRGVEAVVLVVRTEEEEGGSGEGSMNVDEGSGAAVSTVGGDRRRVEELADVERCETGRPSAGSFSCEPNQLCRRGMEERCVVDRLVGGVGRGREGGSCAASGVGGLVEGVGVVSAETGKDASSGGDGATGDGATLATPSHDAVPNQAELATGGLVVTMTFSETASTATAATGSTGSTGSGGVDSFCRLTVALPVASCILMVDRPTVFVSSFGES